ncbi:MAG: NUDIX hydrolase, partial [Planctomycetota bacterium]
MPSNSPDADPTQPPETLLETSRFTVVEHACVARDGSVRKRQVVMHPGAAVILPILRDLPGGAGKPHVVLIRNHRVAVGRTLIELPAGTLEPPEPPLETARRELTEETGYTAARWTPLPGFFMSPGILNERMHCFVAEDLTAGEPQREAGEEIENLVVPLDDAMAMVERGEIE